jgi:serine/threonine-protein kinase
MKVDYSAKGDSFTPARPRAWSTALIDPGMGTLMDVAPDGKRFAVFALGTQTEAAKGSAHVTFLLNFFDELKRRVPAGK